MDRSASPPLRAPDARPRRWLRNAICIVLFLPILGFVGVIGSQLAAEVSALREELAADQGSRVIGYINIHPMPSFARRPDNWFQVADEGTNLWAGWQHGLGHRWFRIGRGELESVRLSHPMGRDVLRAIDQPIVEVSGGDRWDRIPDHCPIYGMQLGPLASAYPVLVLEKVQVINEAETQGTIPVVLTHKPFSPIEEAVGAYDPRLDGRRITLGSAGYLYDGKPLLYDRGSESLWVPEPEGIIALAGPRRGARLRPVDGVVATTWGSWRERHPDGRLIVGADRDIPPPSD